MVRILFTCLLLGFASGMPLALVTSTLQAWYTDAGVSIVQIGFLGLIAQPYVYKFIWAPLLDKHQLEHRISYRKDWILASQMLLLIFVFVISYFDPVQHGLTMGIIACVIAFFSATQDIAIDAYRTEILSESMRGLGATTAIAGYRLGMIFSGGLALILADHLGWRLTYQINACFILLGLIALFTGPQLERPEASKHITFFAAFKDILERKHILSLLCLVLTYRLGEAFTSAMSSLITTFLLRELHLTLSTVGIMTKAVGITATILGGFIGGYIMMHISLYRALLYFGIFQAISNLLFITLTLFHPSIYAVATVIGIENICSGLGTAAFIAFLMSLCKPPYTAAQFAVFSALSASNRVFVAPLSGYIVYYLGWTDYFITSFLASLPAIAIILYLKKNPVLFLRSEHV